MAGNVNQKVVSTPGQIIQGVGPFLVDGVDVGGFVGGVTVTVGQTEVFVKSEWSLGSVDSELTDVTFGVSTELEESTMENLAISWGLPSSSVLSGVSSKTLDLNPANKMQEVGLVFEGMSATNRLKSRTYTVPKAVRVGSTAMVLNRGIKTTLPIQFECLIGSGGSFGTMVETTI